MVKKRMPCRDLEEENGRVEMGKDPSKWDDLRSQFTLPFTLPSSPNTLMEDWSIVRLEGEASNQNKKDIKDLVHYIKEHRISNNEMKGL